MPTAGPQRKCFASPSAPRASLPGVLGAPPGGSPCCEDRGVQASARSLPPSSLGVVECTGLQNRRGSMQACLCRSVAFSGGGRAHVRGWQPQGGAAVEMGHPQIAKREKGPGRWRWTAG